MFHFCTLTHSGESSFLIFHLNSSTFCLVISLPLWSYVSQFRSLGQWDILASCCACVRVCVCVCVWECGSVNIWKTILWEPCLMSGVVSWNDLSGSNWRPEWKCLSSILSKEYKLRKTFQNQSEGLYCSCSLIILLLDFFIFFFTV